MPWIGDLEKIRAIFSSGLALTTLITSLVFVLSYCNPEVSSNLNFHVIFHITKKTTESVKT